VAKKINNKKVKIRNKEVLISSEQLVNNNTKQPNTKQYIIREFVVTPTKRNQSPPWGI
jgi:hypothetical protein